MDIKTSRRGVASPGCTQPDLQGSGLADTPDAVKEKKLFRVCLTQQSPELQKTLTMRPTHMPRCWPLGPHHFVSPYEPTKSKMLHDKLHI